MGLVMFFLYGRFQDLLVMAAVAVAGMAFAFPTRVNLWTQPGKPRGPGPKICIEIPFQLSNTEAKLLVSQNAIPHRKYLGVSIPYGFTDLLGTVR